MRVNDIRSFPRLYPHLSHWHSYEEYVSKHTRHITGFDGKSVGMFHVYCKSMASALEHMGKTNGGIIKNLPRPTC